MVTVRLLLRILWAEHFIHSIRTGPFSPKFPPLDILRGQEFYIVLIHRVLIGLKSLLVDILALLSEAPGLNLSPTARYVLSVPANAVIGHDRLLPNNFSVDR